MGLLAALLMASGLAHAQQASGMYTCKDSRGRTLSSDRPIPECLDREQRQLRTTGGTLRTIGPAYSEVEIARREERARQEELEARLQADERRKERALLTRYPTAASHERERADALAQYDGVMAVARKHLAELASERGKIDEELEFYKSDVNSAPAALRRQFAANVRAVEAQNRFIADQSAERERVTARFDEERARLAPRWNATALSSR